MTSKLAYVTIVVNDYDEAIDFYVNKLGFTLVEDTVLDAKKRWVRVSLGDPKDFCLLLAKAANDKQKTRVGDQTGGRVFLFLHTDDFEGFFKRLQDHGITIVRGPVEEPYGKVAVFADLYGNLWDLIQPAK